MHITATHITYLHLCHRKLWLFGHGIQMEHQSELVAEGKFIGENSYQQRAGKWREVQLAGIKLDHFDVKSGIVKEVKKSSKREQAHIAQLKYYLFVLKRYGIQVSHGLLEYPRMRETTEVWLEAKDENEIPQWEQQVKEILSLEECPELRKKTLCSKCAYREFCFADEE